MKKLITASMMMALGVAGAQAGGGYVDNTQYIAPAVEAVEAAPAATVAGATVLTDVPAGHWAREAVEHVVAAGLVEGFPDGTFRGNEYLTRYQAALIFHRLLQNGSLSSGNISDEDMLVITRGMQEVSEELAAISSRLTDVERLTVEQEARIAALEEAFDGLDMDMDNTALVTRISELEARIAELEGMDVAPTPVEPAPVVPAPMPEDNVEVTPDDVIIGVPDVNVDVDAPIATPGMGNTFFGIGGGYYPTDSKYGDVTANTPYNNGPKCVNPIDSLKNVVNKNGKKDAVKPVDYCGSAFVTVGSSDLMNVGGLGLGGRANIEYFPGANNAVGGDVNAIANFDLGLIQPYAGAGVGVINGPESFAKDAKRQNDIYGNLLLGTDFQLAQNIGLFAEANGKYFFSNKTEAVQRQIIDTTEGVEKGFGYGFRGGLKFFF